MKTFDRHMSASSSNRYSTTCKVMEVTDNVCIRELDWVRVTSFIEKGLPYVPTKLSQFGCHFFAIRTSPCWNQISVIDPSLRSYGNHSNQLGLSLLEGHTRKMCQSNVLIVRFRGQKAPPIFIETFDWWLYDLNNFRYRNSTMKKKNISRRFKKRYEIKKGYSDQ